jgi:hypothetical protein
MIELMRKTYKRYWWFPIVREPLVLGMRFLGVVNRIPIATYAAANPECHGCLRFLKADLKVKSPTFRFLNRFIEPVFGAIRAPRLVDEEVEEAKIKAELMMKTLISDTSGVLDALASSSDCSQPNPVIANE